jgi:hypothetical protein
LYGDRVKKYRGLLSALKSKTVDVVGREMSVARDTTFWRYSIMLTLARNRQLPIRTSIIDCRSTVSDKSSLGKCTTSKVNVVPIVQSVRRS